MDGSALDPDFEARLTATLASRVDAVVVGGGPTGFRVAREL